MADEARASRKMQSRNRSDIGPQAMLVPLNLALAFCGVLPTLTIWAAPFFFASMQIVGAVGMFAGFFSLFALAEIGKEGLVVCAAVLVPAAILLPWMLLARKIPWWLRLLTTAVELPAFGLMYRTVEKLHLEYLQGAFNHLML